MAVRLEHVIARNVAELRQEREWTQRDLALAMTAQGFAWSANRVTQIETLRRSVSLIEMASLCWLFAVPLDRLLDGPEDEAIELFGPDRPTTLGDVRSALRGEAQELVAIRRDAWRRMREKEDTAAARDELRRLGSKLELTGEELDELSLQVYARGFLEERNRRAGDLSDEPKRSAQTKRGHQTRAMLSELSTVIEKQDLASVKRGLQQRLRERLKVGDPR